MNLWNPTGDFSLSQQWIVGTQATGNQTVESGWLHDPTDFGPDSVLFVYFTPDGYKTGCYNLDCTGFIQASSKWTLGAALSHYSTTGGPQYVLTMQWQYYLGNWWLQFNNGSGWDPVGYYPASVYGTGPLASGDASITEFGGEAWQRPQRLESAPTQTGRRWAAAPSPAQAGSRPPSRTTCPTSTRAMSCTRAP